MLSLLKNKKKSEFILEPFDERSIPYACHYDSSTLITKNGELMQVIKIDAYNEEDLNKDKDFDIRAIIRKSIVDNIKDRRFSFWFHTIRRKKNIDSFDKYSWAFAKDTHEGWSAKNYWRSKFINEIYISILHEGENFSMQDNIALTFMPKKFKRLHLKKLEENSISLNNTVEKMLSLLSQYGGRKLSVVTDRFGAHSEILEFLSKIICLRSKRIAMPIQDISRVFARTHIAFGGNSIEIVDEKNKHFAAVFTIKEYHEYSSLALDKLLRIASEYIISQTLNFIDSKEAKKNFEYFNYILTTVSKDEELKKDSGIDSFFKSDKGNLVDYGTQQLTMTIVAESPQELLRSIQIFKKEFHNLGLVCVREDLHLGLVFLSQLPGNFYFFRRNSYIDTQKTASFASLHNTPSGQTTNIWGNALTIFRKDNSAPHFFNLHVNNNGNSLVLGSPESSKNMLTNFLVTESTKYEPNIIYLDQQINSRVFLSALGARYETLTIEGEKPSYNFNPLALSDTPENRKFIKKWLALIIFANNPATEEQSNKLNSSVDELFSNLDAASRKLSLLLDFCDDEVIKNNLSPWCRPNKYGLLFDNPYEELSTGSKTLGLNISNLSKSDDEIALTAIVSYCLYMAGTAFEKSPTIIVINDANSITKNIFFKQNLGELLDNLTKNNALAIFLCTTGRIEVNPNIALYNNKFASKIFLPELNSKIFQESLNLNDEEVKKIKLMKPLYRHFMIKQNNSTFIAELNLDGIDYTIKTLIGHKDAQNAMDKAILEVGDNPNRWIIPYYRNLFPEVE